MVKLNKIKKRRRRPVPASIPKPVAVEPVLELDMDELRALLEKARTENMIEVCGYCGSDRITHIGDDCLSYCKDCQRIIEGNTEMVENN